MSCCSVASGNVFRAATDANQESYSQGWIREDGEGGSLGLETEVGP